MIFEHEIIVGNHGDVYTVTNNNIVMDVESNTVDSNVMDIFM